MPFMFEGPRLYRVPETTPRRSAVELLAKFASPTGMAAGVKANGMPSRAWAGAQSRMTLANNPLSIPFGQTRRIQ